MEHYAGGNFPIFSFTEKKDKKPQTFFNYDHKFKQILSIKDATETIH